MKRWDYPRRIVLRLFKAFLVGGSVLIAKLGINGNNCQTRIYNSPQGGKMEPLFLVHGIFPVYSSLADDFNISAITEDFAYVLDGRGWKIFKRNGVSTALIPIDSLSGLVGLEKRIDFTANKIPLELIRRVTAWFKAVYDKHQSEAVGYLYYCQGTGWDFIPPTQTVSAASAKYEQAPRIEGWVVAGTIHSHASMGAFHSSTDDGDEAGFDGVHITVGRLDSVPEYSCSIVVQGVREVVDPSVLVDGMAPADSVPAEWLSAIKLPAPRLPLWAGEASFTARAEKLYSRYYAGQIAEKDYLVQLRELEEEAAEAKVEAEKKAKRGENFDFPLAGRQPARSGVSSAPLKRRRRRRKEKK